MSVVSTGIGTDNVEIVVAEILAITERPTFIRVGSCGALQPEMGLGDLAITTGAVRLESTTSFFVHDGYPAVADYEAVAALVEAGPDAIQLSPGEAWYLQQHLGPQKPALVLRTDVANVYGPQLPRHLFSELVVGAVEKALRLDASCVVCNLLQLPDQPELFHQCVQNVSALRAACEPLLTRAVRDRDVQPA